MQYPLVKKLGKYYKKKESILDIPIIKKYICERKWRKLCILFKIYPDLLQFHNYGWYLVHYDVVFAHVEDYAAFRQEMSKFGIRYTNLYFKYLYSENEIILGNDSKSNVPVTIKKCTLDLDCERVIKKTILECHGVLNILSEFHI